MKAIEILEKSTDTIKARGAVYDPSGKEERSMAQTVQVFNALTGHELTEREGWIFMVCLKLVRAESTVRVVSSDLEESEETIQASESYMDSVLDGAAYLALSGEAGAL